MPPRKKSKRCCLRCRKSKTRCELPDVTIPASLQALPDSKSCHRCKVLGKSCVVADDGWKPVVQRNPGKDKQNSSKQASKTKQNETNNRMVTSSTLTSTSTSSSSSSANLPSIYETNEIFREFYWPNFSYELNEMLGLGSTLIIDSMDGPSYRIRPFWGGMISVFFKQMDNHLNFRVNVTQKQLNPSLSQCVTELVSVNLHNILQQRFTHHLLWAPFIDNVNIIRNTFEEEKDISSSLLLALVYYVASADYNLYDNNSGSFDISSIRDQLVVIIRRDFLQVMIQAPKKMYAVHSLYLLSYCYPLHDDTNKLHIQEGTISMALSLARSLGIDNAPRQIAQLDRTNSPISSELISEASSWLGLCFTNLNFAMLSENKTYFPPSSPGLEPTKILNLDILERVSSGNIVGPSGDERENYERSIRVCGHVGLASRLETFETLHEAYLAVATSQGVHSGNDNAQQVLEYQETLYKKIMFQDRALDHIFNLMDRSPMYNIPMELVSCYLDWRSLQVEGIFNYIETMILRSLFYKFTTVPSSKTFFEQIRQDENSQKLLGSLGTSNVEHTCNTMTIFCNCIKGYKSFYNGDHDENLKPLMTCLPPFPQIDIFSMIHTYCLLLTDVEACIMVAFFNVNKSISAHLFLLESVAECFEIIGGHGSPVSFGNLALAMKEIVKFLIGFIKEWKSLMADRIYANALQHTNNHVKSIGFRDHNNNSQHTLVTTNASHHDDRLHNNVAASIDNITRPDDSLVELLMGDFSNNGHAQMNNVNANVNVNGLDSNNIQTWF